MKINFREANVDRFIEILLSSRILGIDLRGHILNRPLGHIDFLKQFLPETNLLWDRKDADYICEYPLQVNFSHCFNNQFEPVEAIKERINAVIKDQTEDRLDTAGMAILKHATEKLQFSRDDIQNIVNLAFVIACMDKGKFIRAEHIAEAIQYCKKTFED